MWQFSFHSSSCPYTYSSHNTHIQKPSSDSENARISFQKHNTTIVRFTHDWSSKSNRMHIYFVWSRYMQSCRLFSIFTNSAMRETPDWARLENLSPVCVLLSTQAHHTMFRSNTRKLESQQNQEEKPSRIIYWSASERICCVGNVMVNHWFTKVGTTSIWVSICDQQAKS